MSGILTSVLIASLVPAVFWWLSRKYPAPQLTAAGPTLEELWPRYRKWEWILLVIYLLLWGPVTAAVYWPLHQFAQGRAAAMRGSGDTLVFFMDGAALWLPAFFMGLLLSGVLLTPILKMLLKSRYTEYERYAALRFGFDQNRVMKGFGAIICGAFALAVFALFDAYVVASPDRLRVNTLFGPERRYAYGDVTEVLTAPALIAPNGNRVQRRVYLVKFSDGSSYSTDNMPECEVGNRTRQDLVRVILARSGREAKEKAVFERGEL